MATPMHVYYELAARYGNVDPSDYEAVLKFFTTDILNLDESVRAEIGKELLTRDGEPAKPMGPRKYPENAPAPKAGKALTFPIVDLPMPKSLKECKDADEAEKYIIANDGLADDDLDELVPMNEPMTSEEILQKALNLAGTDKASLGIDLIYDQVNDMLVTGNFAAVNDLLDNAHVHNSSIDMLLALLTVTLPAKSKLTARESFFQYVKKWSSETDLSGLE